MIKKCKICNTPFIKNKNQKCCSNECSAINVKEIDKHYHENNKARCKLNTMNWVKSNYKRKLEQNNKWNKKHPDIIKRNANNWYQNNKERHKQNSMNWRKNNIEKAIEYAREWRSNNKDKYKGIYNDKSNERYKKDVNYRVLKILRSRVHSILKNYDKSTSTLNLVGCNSSDEYRQYIEFLMLPEMHWGNYGIEWEIDHIKGSPFFDFNKLEHQKEYFNYRNQRPLWKTSEIARKYGYNTIGNRNREKHKWTQKIINEEYKF